MAGSLLQITRVRHLWLVLLVSCVYGDPPHGIEASEKVVIRDYPSVRPGPLDVLFAIDDSPAMAPYVDRVLASVPAVADAIVQRDRYVDLHIATIAGDAAKNGVFRTVDTVQGAFVAIEPHPDGTSAVNFTGSLSDVLGKQLAAGTSGPATTQPLEAIRRALDRNVANAGFLRPDGYLSVVIIAAGDDTSLGAVADYAQFLTALEPANNVSISVVSPAVPRLRSFVDAFAGAFARGTWTDLATGDLVSALGAIPAPIEVLYGLPCIDEPLVEPYECTVSDVDANGEHSIPACDGSAARPCWRFDSDPQNCLGDRHRLLVIDRAVFPAAVNHVVLQCLAE